MAHSFYWPFTMVKFPSVPERYVSKFNIYTSALVDENSKTATGFVFTVLTPIVVFIYAIFLIVIAATTIDTTTEVVPTSSCIQFDYACTSPTGCLVTLEGQMKGTNAQVDNPWTFGESRIVRTCPGFASFMDVGAKGWGNLPHEFYTRKSFISIFMSSDLGITSVGESPTNTGRSMETNVLVLSKTSDGWEETGSCKGDCTYTHVWTSSSGSHKLYNIESTRRKLQVLSLDKLTTESVEAEIAVLPPSFTGDSLMDHQSVQICGSLSSLRAACIGEVAAFDGADRKSFLYAIDFERRCAIKYYGQIKSVSSLKAGSTAFAVASSDSHTASSVVIYVSGIDGNDKHQLVRLHVENDIFHISTSILNGFGNDWDSGSRPETFEVHESGTMSFVFFEIGNKYYIGTIEMAENEGVASLPSTVDIEEADAGQDRNALQLGNLRILVKSYPQPVILNFVDDLSAKHFKSKSVGELDYGSACEASSCYDSNMFAIQLNRKDAEVILVALVDLSKVVFLRSRKTESGGWVKDGQHVHELTGEPEVKEIRWLRYEGTSDVFAILQLYTSDYEVVEWKADDSHFAVTKYASPSEIDTPPVPGINPPPMWVSNDGSAYHIADGDLSHLIPMDIFGSPRIFEAAPLGPPFLFLGSTSFGVVPFLVNEGSFSFGDDVLLSSEGRLAVNPDYFVESSVSSAIYFKDLERCIRLSISASSGKPTVQDQSERTFLNIFDVESHVGVWDVNYCIIPKGALEQAHMILVGNSKVVLLNMNDLTTSGSVELSGATSCSSNGTHAFVIVDLTQAVGDASPLVRIDLESMEIVGTGEFEVLFVPAANHETTTVLLPVPDANTRLAYGTVASDLELRIVSVNEEAVGSSTSTESAFGLSSITRNKADGAVEKSVNLQQGSVAPFTERPCSSGTSPSCMRLNVVSTEVVITESKRDALSVVGTIGGFVGSVQLVFGLMKSIVDSLLEKRKKRSVEKGDDSRTSPEDVESVSNPMRE